MAAAVVDSGMIGGLTKATGLPSACEGGVRVTHQTPPETAANKTTPATVSVMTSACFFFARRMAALPDDSEAPVAPEFARFRATSSIAIISS